MDELNIIESNEVFIGGLAPFFDLLALYDFEDKQKEKSEVNSEVLVSAPRVSELNSDFL